MGELGGRAFNETALLVGVTYYQPPPSLTSQNLQTIPATLLCMVFVVICGLALFKDSFPRISLLWNQNRYKRRLLIVFIIVSVCSFIRALYFFGIAISSSTLRIEIGSTLLYTLWWIPELLMSVNYLSILYFWCEVFSKQRGCNIFSYNIFTRRLFYGELALVVCLFSNQFFFAIGSILVTIEYQSNWVIIDSIFIGTVALFLAILPITLGIQLFVLTKNNAESGRKPFYKISILMFLWSFGRFCRFIDVYSSVPIWSAGSFANGQFYWIYVVVLYTCIEVIPQSALLFSAISKPIDQMENPHNLNQLDRKKALTLLRQRVDAFLVDFADWEYANGPKLGHGVYSNVFSGELTKNGRTMPVAIKHFLKALQREKVALESFCKEIETLSSLDHPHILKLLGVHIGPDDQVTMLTELADQGSLSHVLSTRESISHHLKVEWAIQIAKGMAYLHSRSILHRDLKSDNILVFRNDICKIADFGVTTLHSEYEESSGLVGTNHWMAPEMLERRQYDFKVDVYSYVLWEILTQGKIENRSEDYDKPMDGPKFLIELSQICTEELPADRPSFKEIAQFLFKSSTRESAELVQSTL